MIGASNLASLNVSESEDLRTGTLEYCIIMHA